MFGHHFKYSLKALFRDRMLIFWTFAFPLLLATFFYMAFADIESTEKLKVFSIAVVENEDFTQSEIWRDSMEALSKEGEDQMFSTRYVKEEEAKELLEDKEIEGYLLLKEGEPCVVVNADGINQTILKYITEEIRQSETIVNNVAEYEIQKGTIPTEEFFRELYQEAASMAKAQDLGIRNVSGSRLSYTMIEFYTLIAMTCLYGGLLGMVAVNQNLANMSNKGKRVAVSPVRKGQLVLGSVLAGYITQLVGVVLLFLYTVFALKVDYGEDFWRIVILTLCGCLAGLSMGIAVAVLVKSGENLKTGIVLSVTMAGCFLCGMMGITMKYVVDTNLPWLNKINPANMITDGLYALYYYDTCDRYYSNLISLLAFSGLMIAASISGLRRQRYDTI